MFRDHRSYIIPALTPQALEDVAKWRLKGKPVFQRVIGIREDAKCKICADNEYIYVSYCSAGPFRYHPSTRQIVTWFDGSESNGQGWYIVKDTIGYPCPECHGESESSYPFNS